MKVHILKKAEQIWNQYFSRSFFHKIFWVYLGITFGTCLLLFIAIGRNLTSIKYEQALVMSDQCLTTVDTFLKNKIKNAKSIYQRLYLQKDTWDPLFQDLKEPGSSTLYAWQQQEVRASVINTIYAIDRDFNGLFLGSYVDGTIYQYGNANMNMAAEKECFEKWMERSEREEAVSGIWSSRTEKTPGNAFSILLLSPVKSEDFKENIGSLGLYFNAMNIRQSYLDYEKYLKGSLYVLNMEGEILYDSGGAYRFPDDFPVQEVLTRESCQKVLQKSVYNILYSSADGYYVLNALPISAIQEDVKAPRRTMVIVFGFALVVAVILNYISIHFFSKRLQPITDTMKQVREGNLTSFPIQKHFDDELGYIYSELLRMCSALDDHIQKEYVYRLEQKEMELYTLQAQIDPHFLYNTLEAIRMKLYMEGETEASRMIWILSDLFRNQMKKDTVVTNREEIKYLHSYLELFRFRVGSRMRFTIDVEEEVYHYATLKYILQPVVENALLHGIADTGTEERPSTVSIEGRKENGDIVFTVSDDGCGIPEEELKKIQERLNGDELFRESIGIYNVNNRLRIVYGSAYRLKIDSREGEGTMVTVRIRALRKRELEEYVQIVDR